MSAKFLVCFNFQSALMSLKVGEKSCMSVKQLGSRWEVELLGVSSGSKLFAYSTMYVNWGLRVNMVNCTIFIGLKLRHKLWYETSFDIFNMYKPGTLWINYCHKVWKFEPSKKEHFHINQNVTKMYKKNVYSFS